MLNAQQDTLCDASGFTRNNESKTAQSSLA